VPGGQVSVADDRTKVGFFGKLPSRGDFVRIGLSRAFADAWDQWLHAVIPPTRQALGQSWDDAWSRMPTWRFSFAAGLCGATPVSGVWLPSADCVGRRFPLLIAAECAMANDAFLDMAEQFGTECIKAAQAPDWLAQHLHSAPPPLPAGAPASAPLCWWRTVEGTVQDYCCEVWPDEGAFLRMLTA
jgi:type VI secretion system protein ImpM